MLQAIFRFIAGFIASEAAEEGTEAAIGSAVSRFTSDSDRYIENLKETTDEIAEKSISASADIIHDEIQTAIKEVGAVASSSLLNSVTVDTMVSSTDERSIMVGSTSPYARYVEDGVRGGGKMPPTDKIYEWMIAKGLEPSRSSAYLIARKIQRDGIPPKRPFERGVERAIQRIPDSVREIVRTELGSSD